MEGDEDEEDEDEDEKDEDANEDEKPSLRWRQWACCWRGHPSAMPLITACFSECQSVGWKAL